MSPDMPRRIFNDPETGRWVDTLVRRPPPQALRRYADEVAGRTFVRLALYTFAAVLQFLHFDPRGAALIVAVLYAAEMIRHAEVGLIRGGLAERRPSLAGALTWIAPPLYAVVGIVTTAVFWASSVQTEAAHLVALALAMAFVFDAGFAYRWNRRGVTLQIVALFSFAIGLVLASIDGAGVSPLVALEILTLTLFVYVFVTYVSDAIAFRSRQAADTEALIRVNAHIRETAKENERLALVSQHAGDGIVIIAPDGSIEWTNASYVALSGYSSEDLVGKPIGILASKANDPALMARISNAIRRGTPIREQVLVRHREGHDVWLDAAITPIRDEAGMITGFISVERDISRQKAHEAELAEAQRTAEAAASSKAAFLATMSHELRTPLNGVLGTADLLREGLTDPEQTLLVDTITGSAEYLMRIIDNVLEAAKLDAGAVTLDEEPFDLHRLAATSVELLRPVACRKGLSLSLEIADGTPRTVVGDAARVRQIVLNLMGNAIKFTDRGEVRVRAGAVPTEGGICLALAVTDTGIGIPLGRQGAVFENFTQADRDTARRFGGTGLGLSISRQIARQMGGDIVVQSAPGEGATFTATVVLSLPDADTLRAFEAAPTPAADAAPAEAATVGAEPGPPRILVVDDNRTNRFVIEKMLAGTRYALTLVEDGRAAIDAAAAQPPQLILMDLSMPGMDGFETCRAIRRDEDGRDAPPARILALSANGARSERRAARQAGMDGFLTKPVRKAGLIEAIEEALAAHRGDPSPPSEVLAAE